MRIGRKGIVMKKNKLLIIALCLAMVFVMAGCGGKKDNTVTGSKGDEYTVEEETQKAGTEGGEYEPYTITLNLERSGIGQNMEETFTSAPKAAIADGDQMADFLFDLGLEDHMAGYTRGACWSTVSDYPARAEVKQITEPGVNLQNASKEQILALQPDFMMGWDSLFSDQNFSVKWCLKNNIIPYFPYCCSDSATFEDIYKDYDVLGHVFGVTDVAEEKVAAMKEKLAEVEEKLGDVEPVKVFVYDSGEEAPFTACQGVPGDMIKRAGGISIFDDIDKGWATPSWEEVVKRDPDVILILDYDGDTEKKTDFLKSNDFTKNLRAVKEGKIYSACCSDMQGSAGSAGTVEIMAKQFHPDKFK